MFHRQYSKVPTFYQHKGIMSSKIDYIIHIDCGVNIKYTVKTEDRNPLNVSDHTLLICIIPGIIKDTYRSPGKIKNIKRLKWARCYQKKYQEAIRESVANIDIVIHFSVSLLHNCFFFCD